MTDRGAPKAATDPMRPRPLSMSSSATATLPISLFQYLALRKIPWNLAYIGFLCFVVDMITYIVKNGAPFIAVAIFALFFGTRRTQWPFPVRLFLAFWVWAALSTTLSPYSDDFELLIELGKLLLVFLVAVNVLWDRFALRLFLLIYLACFALFPARGTLTNYLIHDNYTFGRPAWAGLFGNPNDLAALTILSLAVAASFLHRETPRLLRYPALLLCMVFPFVILLTQSRGAFLGMCVFLLLSVLSIGRNRIRGILAITILLAVVIVAAPPAVWERIAGLQNASSIETIAEMDAEGSAAERWDILQTALRIIADHPIVGVGRGGGSVALGIYNPKIGPKSFHNTYLEVLAETGVLGLTLFLGLLFSLLIHAKRARRKAHALRYSADWRRLQLLEFGLYGYLVCCTVGTYAYLSLLYVYLAILFAQTVVLGSLSRKAYNPHESLGAAVD